MYTYGLTTDQIESMTFAIILIMIAYRVLFGGSRQDK